MSATLNAEAFSSYFNGCKVVSIPGRAHPVQENRLEDILELTGYPIERVLGRNCRFLQGPETDPAAVARLREAVDNGRGVNVTMLNYRQDGSTSAWQHCTERLQEGFPQPGSQRASWRH